MFKDFFKGNKPADEIYPDKKRVAAIKNSVMERVGTVRKRSKLKPLIAGGLAAAAAAAAVFSSVTATATLNGSPIKFKFGDMELDGTFLDVTDGDGYRTMKFEGRIPYRPESYVVIIDTAAADGNVRIIEDNELINELENIQLSSDPEKRNSISHKYNISDTETGKYSFYSDYSLEPDDANAGRGFMFSGYLRTQKYRDMMLDRKIEEGFFSYPNTDDGSLLITWRLIYYAGDEINEKEIEERRMRLYK